MANDLHIRDEAPGARMGILRVTFRACEALHALTDADNVVSQDEQRVLGIALGMIVRWHVIRRVLG